MNLDRATPEPFLRLHLFHEHINVTVKTISACLAYAIKHLETSTDGKELGNLIAATDPSWSLPPVWNLGEVGRSTLFGRVSELGVIAAHSALDEFAEGTEAEINRWNAYLSVEDRLNPATIVDTDQGRLRTLFQRYQWDYSELDTLIPILAYFKLIRNCIAHRSSRASTALSTLSDDDVLRAAFSDKFASDTIPELPSFASDERIMLDPKLVLLFSHILREHCIIANRYLVEFLGEAGMVNMAVHYAFRLDPPVRIREFKSPEATLNFTLTGRYRVRLADNTEAISLASQIGIWKECLSLFS